MKSTTTEQPWYLAERAEGLGMIYLTEDPRVDVKRLQDTFPGLDFVAALRENGRPGARIFGVKLQAARAHVPGYDGEPGHDNPKPSAWAVPARQELFFRDIPFPVCVFCFTVDDDQGFWGWVKQPSAETDIGPRLIFNPLVLLSPLTAPEVTKLVSEVDRWYNERK